MKTSNKFLLGLLLFFFAGILTLAIAARIILPVRSHQGNGKKVTETRQVSDFTKINLKGAMRVYLHQGTQTELKFQADENLLPDIESTVDNGTLQIRLLRKFNRRDSIAVYITLDTLKLLEFSGGSAVKTLQQFKGNELIVRSSSGSGGNLDLNYHTLTLEASSGSDLRLKGEAGKTFLQFHSGASVKAYDLKMNQCEATGSSGALAKVQVDELIKVNLASGCRLVYHGNALVDIQKITSGADIKKK